MPFLLALLVLLAPAQPSEVGRPWPEIGGLQLGTGESRVRQLLGSVDRETSWPADAVLGMGPTRTLWVRGLVVHLHRAPKRKSYEVMKLEIAGGDWRINRTVGIGSLRAEVHSALGEPGEVASENGL